MTLNVKKSKQANPAIILFNKPYGVQSQFRQDKGNRYQTLADYFTDKTLRIAGRLDAKSEGLLILTGNSKLDGQINKLITEPSTINHTKLGKTYLVQVEGDVSKNQIKSLIQGVMLKDGKTLPAQVKQINENELPIKLWQRNPPIRQRDNIATSWLQMTIFEGKNRQIRRMTAHVGLPCLRLIRYSVADFQLGNLKVGEFVRVSLNKEKLKTLGVEL
ncbi:MAG: pseudouridine synthase [Moraxellaceae bacterium]|nr:pseudouridine synthase [Moraxellaceae bacterium]